MGFFLNWDGNKDRSLGVIWKMSFLVMAKFISFGVARQDLPAVSVRCVESP